MPLHETTIEELIDEQLIEETKQFIRDQSEKIFYLEKETVSKKD